MANEKGSEKEMQQKYLQFQQLQQQMQQIVEHLELLHQQNTELDISKKALEELSLTKVDNEILAPIANGIFVQAALKNNQKLILNVGSNTTVERTVPETVELLEKQQQEVIRQILDAEHLLQKLNEQALKIYREVEENVL